MRLETGNRTLKLSKSIKLSDTNGNGINDFNGNNLFDSNGNNNFKTDSIREFKLK